MKALSLSLSLRVAACCCDVFFCFKAPAGLLSFWECKGRNFISVCKLFRGFFFFFWSLKTAVFLAPFKKSTKVLTSLAPSLAPSLSKFFKRLSRLCFQLFGRPKFSIYFLLAKPFFKVFSRSLLLFLRFPFVWGCKGKKLFSFCKGCEEIFSFFFLHFAVAAKDNHHFFPRKSLLTAASSLPLLCSRNLAAAPFGPLSLSFDLGVQR